MTVEEIKPEVEETKPEETKPKVERSLGDVVVGTIKMWSVARNHGFLKCDDGGEDLFCHKSALKCQEGFAAVMVGTRVKGVIEKNPEAEEKDDERVVLSNVTAEDGELLPGYETKQDFLVKKIEHQKSENPDMMEISLVLNKLCSGKVIGQAGSQVKQLQESHQVNISIYPPTLEVSEEELGKNLQQCKIKGEKEGLFSASGGIFQLFLDLMAEKKDEVENLDTVLFGRFGKLLSAGTTVATLMVPLTSLEAVEGELKSALEATGVSVSVLSKEKVGKHFCLVFTGTPEQIRDAVAATVTGLPTEIWYQPRPLNKKRKKQSAKKTSDKRDNNKNKKQKKGNTPGQRGKQFNEKGPKPPPEFNFGKSARRSRGQRAPEPAWTPPYGGGYSAYDTWGYDAWPAPPARRAGPKQSMWQPFYDQAGEQYFRNVQTGECHY